jgi:hypothetical protein
MLNDPPQDEKDELDEFYRELRKRNEELVPDPRKKEKDPVLLERKPFHWWSWYPPRARRGIRFEAGYLLLLLLASILFLWVSWRALESTPIAEFLAGDAAEKNLLQRHLSAFLGGVLGGAVYALKWLYHAVARGGWHLDRRLWRIVAPLLSGVMALAFYSILQSGIFNVKVDRDGSEFAFAFGFLVGLFSDKAAGKLSEIADSLFGQSAAPPPGPVEPPSPPPPAPGKPGGGGQGN